MFYIIFLVRIKVALFLPLNLLHYYQTPSNKKNDKCTFILLKLLFLSKDKWYLLGYKMIKIYEL